MNEIERDNFTKTWPFEFNLKTTGRSAIGSKKKFRIKIRFGQIEYYNLTNNKICIFEHLRGLF